MITLTEPWDCGYMTFPVGTVFIPQKTINRGQKGTIYAYACTGASGEIFCGEGKTPGVQIQK